MDGRYSFVRNVVLWRGCITKPLNISALTKLSCRNVVPERGAPVIRQSFLTDISQITPKFREIVPPFHRQGKAPIRTLVTPAGTVSLVLFVTLSWILSVSYSSWSHVRRVSRLVVTVWLALFLTSYNVDKYDGPAIAIPEEGSIIADPLFVDPANGDYNLLADSPAYTLGFVALEFSALGTDGFDPVEVTGGNVPTFWDYYVSRPSE